MHRPTTERRGTQRFRERTLQWFQSGDDQRLERLRTEYAPESRRVLPAETVVLGLGLASVAAALAWFLW